ncbi:hypothetical protein K5M76_21800 (plasmid) [Shewanella xiamenensis]|uniref:Uncharacterized protein n=1 Tax=Shewanella putrefaciens (strain 200) TaxID=399804 RepID=E6XSE3_SHEP2|nr:MULTISPECIES: hypothetical protein [Shewanella]MCD8552103.1 hypothetical protein [Shewanella xiamenensis]MCK7657656.1 hypothetical protein [Shewanella sp. JNE4-2]MCT8858155.1 hypothetical protein [Shewanella xiamenensis]UWG67028.1 hypothetical protein K5M76_21800 [Shewanella xiamenensis]
MTDKHDTDFDIFDKKPNIGTQTTDAQIEPSNNEQDDQDNSDHLEAPRAEIGKTAFAESHSDEVDSSNQRTLVHEEYDDEEYEYVEREPIFTAAKILPTLSVIIFGSAFLYFGNTKPDFEAASNDDLASVKTALEHLQTENSSIKSELGAFAKGSDILALRAQTNDQQSKLDSLQQTQNELELFKVTTELGIANNTQNIEQVKNSVQGLTKSQSANSKIEIEFTSKLDAISARINELENKQVSFPAKAQVNQVQGTSETNQSQQHEVVRVELVTPEPVTKRVRDINGLVLESIDVWNGNYIATVSEGYNFQTLSIGKNVKGYTVVEISRDSVKLTNNSTFEMVSLVR